ncbi:hypothetical protein GQ55_6G052600 [Panicum hallii var. hallii]|uniref:Uncharacterized protein n=1 Tax=Panicum hallii var. hallii TaxID=1504633 RepID=A0A2T7D432_9POAL|nr:hypothetical protein GQ55_6G052600 [Panicum hallii var. hallii]
MTPTPPPRVHPTLRVSPSTTPPRLATTNAAHPSSHAAVAVPSGSLENLPPFPFPGGRGDRPTDRDAPSALPKEPPSAPDPPLPPRHAAARRRGYSPSTRIKA